VFFFEVVGKNFFLTRFSADTWSKFSWEGGKKSGREFFEFLERERERERENKKVSRTRNSGGGKVKKNQTEYFEVLRGGGKSGRVIWSSGTKKLSRVSADT
jgi:hypothetical protein